MKKILAFLLVISAAPVWAQSTALQDTLLDQMTGTWVLEGTIAGAQTTHDIQVDWILAHEYIQIREVSREKDSTGAPMYQALVTIGWNPDLKKYACLWLDNTGGNGLVGSAFGHAPREASRLPFLFIMPGDSPFHTTFLRDRAADTWQWIMDGEENGKLRPFARVTLRRAR